LLKLKFKIGPSLIFEFPAKILLLQVSAAVAAYYIYSKGISGTSQAQLFRITFETIELSWKKNAIVNVFLPILFNNYAPRQYCRIRCWTVLFRLACLQHLHVQGPSEQVFKNKLKACSQHRHRTDDYLYTLLVNQTAQKALPPTGQKSQSQDGGLPELLLAYSCLTNHSEAASL